MSVHTSPPPETSPDASQTVDASLCNKNITIVVQEDGSIPTYCVKAGGTIACISRRIGVSSIYCWSTYGVGPVRHWETGSSYPAPPADRYTLSTRPRRAEDEDPGTAGSNGTLTVTPNRPTLPGDE